MQSWPADIREHYYILNQNLTDYANVGFVDLSVLPSAINYVIINTLVLGIPITAEFLRRKVSSKITSTIDTISESKRSQTRTFLKGLTIQVVLPLFLYVPVFLCQLYTTIAKQEVLFQQYLIFELPVISTVLDPLISMYFITPYRRTIKKRFQREKQATTDAHIPSVFVVM
ncbi:Protein CBG05287 [Caenorhabditis briggsae]|uniref:Protein CBG05287 n=1 Tax=Caenorhabditis briggsae TaxID=6238 RepID=A8WZJ3_CAEBR|nr:Protein CBG05287 [Caenorhabditis briggsae]CAP25803.2 Protein CBG05287 [Caenorhabditis briggsae]